jgi:hypothetical protein
MGLLTHKGLSIVGISSVKENKTQPKMSNKNLTLVTPIGTAVYPKLVEPDTAFDEVGAYTCKIHVSEEEYEAFKAKVDPLATAAYDAECQRQGKPVKKAKSCPLRITEDGDYEILAKQKAKVTTRAGDVIEFSIPLFDAQVKAITTKPKIGSGSKIRMSVTFYPWYVPSQGWSYTLRLKEAQILELIEYSVGNAGGSFSTEAGGYTTSGESLNDALEQKQEEQEQVAPF